jgi:hypothetical protein
VGLRYHHRRGHRRRLRRRLRRLSYETFDLDFFYVVVLVE